MGLHNIGKDDDNEGYPSGPHHTIVRLSGEAYFTSEGEISRRTAAGKLESVPYNYFSGLPDQRDATVVDALAPGGHVIAITARVTRDEPVPDEWGNTADFVVRRSVDTLRVGEMTSSLILPIDDLTLYRKQVLALEGGALVVEPPNASLVIPKQVRADCGVRIARPLDLSTSKSGDLRIVGEDCTRPGRPLVESWNEAGESLGVEEIDLDLGHQPGFPEKRLVIEAGGSLEALLGLGASGVRLFVRDESGRFVAEPFVAAAGILDADVAVDGTLYAVVVTRPELAARCDGATVALVRRTAPGELTCHALDRKGRPIRKYAGLFAASSTDAYVALTDTAWSMLLATGAAREFGDGTQPASTVDEVQLNSSNQKP